MKQFYAGAAWVDITPPLEVPYLSVSPRHSQFSAVHDPLRVCAVVVSDGETPVALISVDSIGFDNRVLGAEENYTAHVRRLISQSCGITPENIFLSAGHIHSSPDMLNFRDLSGFPQAKPWFYEIARRTAQAVAQAFDALSPAVLKHISGQVEGVSENRREDDFIDKQLITLMFECENGTNIVISHFACHPVIVQAQPLVSADYVGVMRKTVEEGLPNSVFMLLQGCAGDTNPNADGKGGFEQVLDAGLILGTSALEQAKQMLGQNSVSPCDILCVRKEILLPSRKLPSAAQLGIYADDEDAQARIDEGEIVYPCELQAIKLGECLVLGIAGEPFCQMGLELKKQMTEFVCMPTGYANGYVGYICPPQAFEKGGYETEIGPWCKVSGDSFDIIMNTLGELYNELRRRNDCYE